MHQISIWEHETFFSPQDIIIVGAGFTGLWTAFHLKEKFPSKKITIIEQHIIPTGASGRNAGFACFGSLTEIISDIKSMGVEKSLQLIRLRYEGLNMIRSFFADSIIDYTNCGGYELLNDDHSLNKIAEINKLLQSLTNSSNTFRQNNSLIKKFGFSHIQHLVENKFEGALHSGKLLKALSQLVISKGVQILCSTKLEKIEERKDCVILSTNLAEKLQAEQIIICTNAFTQQLIADIDLVPARGQVLLTEPINGLKIKGCFHYDEGFYYFRNLGNRILLGGARNKNFEKEKTLEMATTSFIQNELDQFLSHIIIPHKKPLITHRWAGVMAIGADKSPIVKRLSERIFCAVRLSGMGVALAPKIGLAIANMMEN